MALTLTEKKAVVEEVAKIATNSLSAVTAEYRGLTVDKLTELRKTAREKNVYLRVIKNSLAKRAVSGTEFECMQETFTGPLIFAFSQTEPGSAARLIKDFAKENDLLKAQALAIGGKLLDASDLERLASLPTKDEAISMLLSVMKAPVGKLARTLNEVPGKLVRTLAAVKDAK